jgi:methyl-accepting chemotaxis protein
VSVFSRLSIRAIIGTLFALMGIMVITVSVSSVLTSLERQASADRVAKLTVVGRTLLQTLLASRLERGAHLPALGANDPANSDTLGAIESNCQKSVSGYQQATDAIAQLELADLEKVSTQLRSVHEQMQTLRPAADAAIRQQKASRDAEVVQKYQKIPQAYLDAITAVIDQLDASMQPNDPTIDHLLTIKRAAWATRLNAGAHSVKVQTAVAGNLAWTPAEALAAAEDRGRIAQAWSLVVEASSHKDMPKILSEKVALGQQNFVGPAADATKKIVETLGSGQKSDVPVNDLRKRDTENQGYIVDVAHAALDEMVRHADAQATRAANTLLANIALLAGAALLTIIGLLIAFRRVSNPIRTMTAVMREFADGSLDREVPYVTRGDEIGSMAGAVQVFRDSMLRTRALEAEAAEARVASEAQRKQMMRDLADTFENAVGDIVNAVSTAATGMQATAQQLTGSARQTSERSTAVAAAAEQTSVNVLAMSSATEELGASVGEIGRQVEDSANMSRDAVLQATATSQVVSELSTAAERIGAIVQMISTIAGQTNLLALNATIEAARAGEAGRGFAVVAAEVKDLADQTAKATAEISNQIAAIQTSTTQAVQAIGGITQRIKTMNDVASSIASAVEQQGFATREIIGSVSQASVGTTEVTTNIGGVAQVAEETEAAAAHVLASSTALANQAQRLRTQVDRFVSDIRAA